jgi:hypothetical protein
MLVSGVGLHFGSGYLDFPGNQATTKNQFFDYQNQYVIDDKAHMSIEAKWRQVDRLAFNADPSTPTSSSLFKLNFLSGAGPSLKNPLPWQLAADQNGPNIKLLQKLKERDGKEECIGITVMDFPGDELIERIVRTNRLSL